MVFIFQFVNVVYYIELIVDIEESLHGTLIYVAGGGGSTPQKLSWRNVELKQVCRSL